MLDPVILDVARAVERAGGRALLVGGYVRDRLLGIDAKDVDVEVFGLDVDALESVLASFGRVLHIGRSFGVLRLAHLDVDFSLPRRDSKIAPGHRGFAVSCDPHLDFRNAARRRDLTINSMSLDPLRGELIDPFEGRRDLDRGVLRATDERAFSEDPLRALRVAQFIARFDMRPEPALSALCREADLDQISGERIFGELRKLLLKGRRPSAGLGFLETSGLLRFFPELAALVGVPQDPLWHPEGDVWVHTRMVVDEAATLRDGGDDDLALMLGALCHDLGKPATTLAGADGRIRSPAHSERGVEPTLALLERLRAPKELVRRVCALVEHHLAPALFVRNRAGAKGYRRLARKLHAAGASFELLVRVARADHLGRSTEDARARSFPAGERFLDEARALLVAEEPPRDAVMGRHLIARGLRPGPAFAGLLERCREVQDEENWQDPDRIIDAVLSERGLAVAPRPGFLAER